MAKQTMMQLNESTNTLSKNQFQIAQNCLLNWLLSPKSAVLDTEPGYIIDIFREQLATGYNLYPHGEQGVVIELPLWSIPATPNLAPLRQIQKLVQSHPKSFSQLIIHGSVVTDEVIPNWSDIDLLAVIHPGVLQDTNLLRHTRQLLRGIEYQLKQFDGHQHHGVQCIAPTDLHYYPEVFLPLATWRHSQSLIAAEPITFYLRDSSVEQRDYVASIARLFAEAAQTGLLKHHAKDGVYLENQFKNADNAWYQFKYFISVVLLTPSLFLAVVDQPIYKKESFNKITDYFTETELQFLRQCEQVRLAMANLPVAGNAIPLEIQRLLPPDYFERAAQWLQLVMAAVDSRVQAPQDAVR